MAKNKFNDGPGPSQRQLRVGELIRRALSDILMQGIIHDPDLNRISVTVSEVTESTDLTIVTAYVCPLGGKGGENLLALLARHKSDLRISLSENITARSTPGTNFPTAATIGRKSLTLRLCSQERLYRNVNTA